jgi:hypothetical protein
VRPREVADRRNTARELSENLATRWVAERGKHGTEAIGGNHQVVCI